MEYTDYQIQKEKEYENTCARCGSCCGVKDDPCIHLMCQSDGTYLCDIYSSRGDIQKTLSGNFFKCVALRDILHEDWNGNRMCAYKKSQQFYVAP